MKHGLWKALAVLTETNPLVQRRGQKEEDMEDDRTEEEQIRDVIEILNFEYMRARDLDRARRAGRRKKCARVAEVPSQESAESARQSPRRESPPLQKPTRHSL